MIKHPCQSCGACCAFFRVSFHWSEVLTGSHGVPALLTEKISPHMSAMIGTNKKNPRCASLKGEIGVDTTCRVYENRSSSCRSFEPSFENGRINVLCEQARLGKGLTVLTSADWPDLVS